MLHIGSLFLGFEVTPVLNIAHIFLNICINIFLPKFTFFAISIVCIENTTLLKTYLSTEKYYMYGISIASERN